MSDILISGYYGFKNSGDDALLLAIINDLREKKSDIDLAVFSGSKKETEKEYGIRAINRLNPFCVIWELLRTKMLLSGGGTLIQDRTSTKSLIYYLAIISIAKVFGKKTMLYANGIGPIREENKKLTKKTLNKVDIITLRDSDSLAELKALGVDKPEIVLTADPAFNLNPENLKKGEDLLSRLGFSKEDKIACISVREWKSLKENFEEEIAKTADYLSGECGYKVLILSMQASKDGEISKRVIEKMTEPCVFLDEKISIDEMLYLMRNAKLCIGMRLHSLIYASAGAVPVIGLVYDPKIAGFMDYISQPLYLNVEEVTFPKLKELIRISDESSEEYRKKMNTNIEKLKIKAKENADIAIELLERNKRGKKN